MQVANAGCITPIVWRVGGSVEWVDVGGMPLGTGLGVQVGYAEIQIALAPGDLVVFTSDGVVEAQNSIGHMFGFERLEQAVQSGEAYASARRMLAHLKTKVSAFVGETEQHDDLTIVVIGI